MMARTFLSRATRVCASVWTRPAEAAVGRRNMATSPNSDKAALNELFGTKKAAPHVGGSGSGSASVVDSDAVVQAALSEANGGAATSNVVAPLTGERVSVLVQGVTVNLDECWWSTRACLQLIEAFHDVSALPWWATLVGFVFVLRTALLPLIVANLQNGAKLQAITPVITEFQTLIKNADSKEEKMAHQMRMMETMKKSGYKASRPLVFAFVQLPIFITAFRAQTLLIPLHADEMATGGLAWFTNLAYTDPYYALPLISSLFMLASMELGAEGIAEKHRRMFRFGMRGLCVVSVPLLAYLPTGSMLFILAHNIFSLGWTLLMRVPSVRSLLGLPATPPSITIATPPPNTPPPPPTTQRFYNAESGKLEVKPISKK